MKYSSSLKRYFSAKSEKMMELRKRTKIHFIRKIFENFRAYKSNAMIFVALSSKLFPIGKVLQPQATPQSTDVWCLCMYKNHNLWATMLGTVQLCKEQHRIGGEHMKHFYLCTPNGNFHLVLYLGQAQEKKTCLTYSVLH